MEQGQSESTDFRHSIQVGLSFGLTSGIITTLGLLVGLAAGTSSRLAVIGGVLSIALADSLSDALGIHISEEAENVHSNAEIWLATIATFFSKLAMSLSFLVPVLLLDVSTAVLVSVGWAAVVLTLLSLRIARAQRCPAMPVVFEHLAVAALVVVAAHGLGRWIAATFA